MILGKPAERQGRKVKRLNGKPHDRLTAFLSKRTQSAFIFTKIRTERINNAYKNRRRNGALYTGGRGPDGRSGTAARPKESEISAPCQGEAAVDNNDTKGVKVT